MTNRQQYFERAESWAADTQILSARSRRTAWTIAGIAIAIAAFEAVALAMLAPLKTVQPITLLVDRQTGYVQALDPLTPRRVAADEALTNAFLAQYVMGREGFDRATISTQYRRVALWSAARAREGYLAQMPAANPASPFQRYPAGTIVDARVKSVSRLSQGTAMVRFDTQVEDRSGRADTPQPWIAVVRFRYSDAPMRLEDRLVNPLGFQVVSYRRDAEAPPPPPAVQAVVAASVPVPAAVVTTTTTVSPARATGYSVPSRQRARVSRPTAPVSDQPREPALAPLPRTGARERREVPLNNLPMGSPLSSTGTPIGAVVAGVRR